MALLKFRKDDDPTAGSLGADVEALLENYSIEVMPRTAEKVEDFSSILPAVPVYILRT